MRRLLVAVSASLVALVAAQPAWANDPVTLTGGHGDWGVKASFRSYVVGPIAHGSIATSEGATVNADGTFRFPVAGGDYDEAADAGEVRLSGTLVFTGHDGLLYLEISDPRVELAGDGGTLFADVRSKSLATGELVDYPGVDVASLDLTGIDPVVEEPEIAWSPIPATLTEAGAPAFAGFYTAGTALDPVSLEVVYGVAPPPPAPTGLSTDPASPANANRPRVKGTAADGTTVKLYASATCAGQPVATGSTAQLAAPGLEVAVADNSTTTFTATAENADGVSDCSGAVVYREVTASDPPAARNDPPAPLPPAPPAEPAATAPAVELARKRQTVSQKRIVRVATVACGSGTCRLTLPKKVRFRIAGKSYRAQVLAPARLEAGETAQVRVKLTSAAMKALRGRSATVRLSIAVRSGTDVTTTKAALTIRRG